MSFLKRIYIFFNERLQKLYTKVSNKFFFSFFYCTDQKLDEENQRGWLLPDFSTTDEEINIFKYVRKVSSNEDLLSVLHIGIGNSDLDNYIDSTHRIDGLSLSIDEIDSSKYNGEVKFLNKYNSNELSNFLKNKSYNYIIDSNLFSYACCYFHALRYFEILNLYIKESNCSLITSHKGLSYSPLNVHIKLDELKKVSIIDFNEETGVIKISG